MLPQRCSSAVLVVMGYVGAVAALLLGWGICCIGSAGIGVVGVLALLRALGSIFVAVAAMQPMVSSVRLRHPRMAALFATLAVVIFEVAWVVLFVSIAGSQPYIPSGVGVICMLIIAAITYIGFSQMTPAGGPGFPIELTHRE